MGVKRIIDLETLGSISEGDYIPVDNETGGTKKYPASALGGGGGADTALRASTAADYDPTQTYEAGEYCLRNGQLYECTTAITQAEAWNASHWTARTVGGQLETLKSDLNSNGITDDLRDALLQLAAKVAYIDDDGQDYYDDLEDALMANKWKITNTLSNCVSSNSSKFVDKGSSYSATISASTGYILIGATVSVTMGGTDITSTAYNNGSITIASVTGNVVISVTAATVTVSSISAVYTQSGTVYDTDSLDSLKTDLVVTATYSDTTTATVPSADYILSGTLTAGTSTVTVTYEGKTTTFNVTVTANRSSIFGTFVDGHAVSKITSGTTIPVGGIYIASASARAAFSTPIANNNYVFTVTDTTKYNIAVYDVADNTPISTTYSAAIEHVYYTGGSKSISWKTTDSAETPYIIVSLKKLDNTAFTAAELANGAEAVFTFTTT